MPNECLPSGVNVAFASYLGGASFKPWTGDRLQRFFVVSLSRSVRIPM
jgi:hypothetical protein